MKKYVLAAVCLLFLLLSACGGPGAEGTPTPEPTPEATETPAPTPTPTPEPAPTFSGVYTDWSKLEPYEPVTPVYTRRYEGFTDTLIPADDYGPLMPFAGTRLTVVDEDLLGMYDEGFELYGLVTLEGEVVVDPVFTSIEFLEEYDNAYCLVSQPDVLLLGKTVYDEEGHPEHKYALCAGGGSWCTDFLYEYSWEMTPRITFAQGVPLGTGDGKLVFLDLDTRKELRTLDLAAQVGSKNITISTLYVDENTGWSSVLLYYWGEGGESCSTPLLFDPDGKPHPLPPEVRWIYQYGDGLVPASAEVDEGKLTNRCWGYIDASTGKWAIEPRFVEAQAFINGVAPVRDEDGIYFINTAGERLTEYYRLTGKDSLPAYHEGRWYVSEDYTKIKVVLDEALNPVESPVKGVSEHSFWPDGWIHCETSTDSILVRGDEVYSFAHGRGYLTHVKGDRVFFIKSTGITITDLEGNEIAQIGGGYNYGTVGTDWITDEGYIYAYSRGRNRERTDIYDMDGNLLMENVGNGDVRGGMIYLPGKEWTTLTDREGNIIFHWPVHSAWD